MAKERVVSKLRQVRGISMREKIVETAENYGRNSKLLHGKTPI
ncbi:MAG: hypothetical protein WCR31_06810 [Treponema sp.]